MAIDSWVFCFLAAEGKGTYFDVGSQPISEPWQLHALQTIHSSYDCVGDHATRAPGLYAARIIKEVFMCTSQ